jgi:hypothetical protein
MTGIQVLPLSVTKYLGYSELILMYSLSLPGIFPLFKQETCVECIRNEKRLITLFEDQMKYPSINDGPNEMTKHMGITWISLSRPNQRYNLIT